MRRSFTRIVFALLLSAIQSFAQGRDIVIDNVTMQDLLSTSVVPRSATGAESGMRFLAVRDGTLWQHLGVQRGDILLKINNVATKDMPGLVKAFQELIHGGGQSHNVTLERDARILKIKFQIENSSTTSPPLSAAPPSQGKHPLHVVGICSIGFEDVIQGHGEVSVITDNPEDEIECDRHSLRGFARAFGLKPDLFPGEAEEPVKIESYDIDRDGAVTCNDYYAWKRWMKAQFERGPRKTDGSSITLSECPTPA